MKPFQHIAGRRGKKYERRANRRGGSRSQRAGRKRLRAASVGSARQRIKRGEE